MSSWTAYLVFHVPHATWDYKKITRNSEDECITAATQSIKKMESYGWGLQEFTIYKED